MLRLKNPIGLVHISCLSCPALEERGASILLPEKNQGQIMSVLRSAAQQRFNKLIAREGAQIFDAFSRTDKANW